MPERTSLGHRWQMTGRGKMHTLITEHYATQVARWPQAGRHLMAQFDDEAIVVYQAYRPAIGHYAEANRRFGGEFSFSRMSWIKPNFLWMMYRSGWGTKPGQEVTLAVWLRRAAFDAILAAAVPSTFDPDRYATADAWREAVANSDVRLQWDPDHDPAGAPLARRAIQLGLRGDTLAHYATDWLLDIQDISAFVAKQRAFAQAGDYQRLLTTREEPYPANHV
jgi:hypothetical protein